MAFASFIDFFLVHFPLTSGIIFGQFKLKLHLEHRLYGLAWTYLRFPSSFKFGFIGNPKIYGTSAVLTL